MFGVVSLVSGRHLELGPEGGESSRRRENEKTPRWVQTRKELTRSHDGARG